jgi:hypothetical protein
LLALDVAGHYAPFRTMLERAHADGLLYGSPHELVEWHDVVSAAAERLMQLLPEEELMHGVLDWVVFHGGITTDVARSERQRLHVLLVLVNGVWRIAKDHVHVLDAQRFRGRQAYLRHEDRRDDEEGGGSHGEPHEST